MGAIIFWIVLLLFFLVFEAATIELVSIWFIGGSFAALLAAVLNVNILIQFIIFFVVSLVLLIAFRPFFRKKLATPMVATNIDMVIGSAGIVTQRIDNVVGTGSVNMGGQQWTARSLDGNTIEQGTRVRARDISGARLIVSAES